MTLRQLLQDLAFNQDMAIKRNATGLLKALEKSGLKIWLDDEIKQKKKGFWCYEEHTSGKYGGCSIPHWHE